MAEALVLDASAALSLVLEEPRSSAVRQALVRMASARLLVVDLFWLEVSNVLVRRHGWDADAVVAALRELDHLGLETVPLDRPLLLAALDYAANGVSMYDAAYVALAEAEDALLLTLDARLGAAAGRRAALPLGRGTNETRAPYAADVAPIDWARHGQYLAELRRAATG